MLSEIRIVRTTEPGQELTERDKLWPGRLRLISRAHLRLWELSDYTDSVSLLLTELVTNAFQHGEGAEVAVRLYRTAKLIRIEVDDGSPRVPIVRPSLPMDESGRGIPLVDAIADAWGTGVDGTRTWCTLTITASQWC